MDRLTSLLDQTPAPEALRKLEPDELPRLAGELRAEVIAAAAEAGGHFGGGLGVVELTVALHYVFDTWRVGRILTLKSGPAAIPSFRGGYRRSAQP